VSYSRSLILHDIIEFEYDHPGRTGDAMAERLLERGADRDWIGYDRLTSLDAALRSDAHELADWLRARGARSAPGTDLTLAWSTARRQGGGQTKVS
jgi:hypothetical protein